jgi:hypothetical protein
VLILNLLKICSIFFQLNAQQFIQLLVSIRSAKNVMQAYWNLPFSISFNVSLFHLNCVPEEFLRAINALQSSEEFYVSN